MVWMEMGNVGGARAGKQVVGISTQAFRFGHACFEMSNWLLEI